MNAQAIAQAKRNAGRARARVNGSVAALKYQLAPSTIAEQAKRSARQKANRLATNAIDAVTRRPATIGLAAGLITLFLARRPIGRQAARLWRRKATDRDQAPIQSTQE